MSTLKEIYDAHRQRMNEAVDRYIKEIENHIKELGFGKRVIRIKDGREGELRVVRSNSYTRADINFYPITRAGTVSKHAEGFILLELDKLEEMYRPK